MSTRSRSSGLQLKALMQRCHAAFAVAGLVGLAGCVTSAGSFKPSSVGQQEGALFGRVIASNLTEELTKHCYLELTDASAKRLRYLSMDESGWVFTSVKPGEVHVSLLLCRDGGQLMQFETRTLSFQAKAGARIAYFGELRVLFPRESEDGFLEAVKRGLTPPIATISADPPPAGAAAKAEVYNRYEEALKEYKARYGAEAARLTPELALVSPAVVARKEESPAPPSPAVPRTAPSTSPDPAEAPQSVPNSE